MLNKLSALFESVLHKRTEQIHLSEPIICNAIQHDPDDLEIIAKLRSDLSSVEYLHGREYVIQQRCYIKHRLVTIAKSHLSKARWISATDWINESKCLVRYFSSLKENDADKAIQMLLPFADKYKEARTPKTTLRPKPHGRNMGANQGMTTTAGSGS